MHKRVALLEDVVDLEDYIVRIETHTGKILGTGFFVGPNEVLTCAHVCEGIPDPIRDVRLVVPVRKPPHIGDAHVDYLFPETWEPEKVYPDVALLTVKPNPNRPFLRFREGWRESDSVSGIGFSEEGELLDSYHGIVSGPAVVDKIPEGANPDHYRLIKFYGSQIAPGFSGSPMINSRTGSVCGMVKKTRGPQEDRGGYGVQAEVIIDQLPQLRDRGEMVVPKSRYSMRYVVFLEIVTHPFSER
jgi:hypothetical protein